MYTSPGRICSELEGFAVFQVAAVVFWNAAMNAAVNDWTMAHAPSESCRVVLCGTLTIVEPTVLGVVAAILVGLLIGREPGGMGDGGGDGEIGA